MEGYCLKCKVKREMKDIKKTTTKRGTPMYKGICPKCSTKMCRIGN